MLLSDLRRQFNATISISNEFFELMEKTFGFYTTLCNDFLNNFGKEVQENKLEEFLQNQIRTKLFSKEHCETIEDLKKKFLSEHIKLEQFIKNNNFKRSFINDLEALKQVSNAIYELLQKHWDLFKYENTVVNNEVLISFILQIDKIGISWDSYLEKYLAVSTLLNEAAATEIKKGHSAITVKYNISEEIPFTLEVISGVISFLQEAFNFVKKVQDRDSKEIILEILSIEVKNPVDIVLLVPDDLVASFIKFLGYLSVDVLKRETLVKFVMEVVRLQQGKELSSNSINAFRKKITKQIEALPANSYISVDENENEDSVKILSALCKEMDKLKIKYEDLMTGATNRLARNGLLNYLTHKKEDPQETDQEPIEVKVSTVKLDIKRGEHIGFLTS